MKQMLTFMGCFCLCLTGLSSQILYVSDGATGNGESWESPLGNLQAALYLSEPGTQIWVAQGSYFPVNCKNCSPDDREVSFNIPSGVEIYGGFAGFEKSLEERNWRSNPTQLSGDIGRDDLFDNSHTIVSFENASSETVLDGFFIMHGYADEQSHAANPSRSGGGILNQCTQLGATSAPVISNCVFLENYAFEGGAIYNHGQSGTAITLIENCSFVKNQGFLAGGAIFDDNPSSSSTSMITDSRLVKNKAIYGGGYFTVNSHATLPIFFRCQLTANEAELGAVAFFLTEERVETAAIFHQDCVFKNNKSGTGEALYFQEGRQLPEEVKQLAEENLFSDL